MKCPLSEGGLGRRCLRGDTHAQLSEGRRGADDESAGSDFASDGEEDYVVAGRRNPWHERPADAAVALAVSGAWVWRVVGPAGGQAEPEARAAGGGRAGSGAVPGEIFRSERAAFSRKAEARAANSVELHLGEEGVARSGAGASRTKAGGASAEAGAAAVAGDVAAHRWQPASVVSGRPLVRLAGDTGRRHQRDLLRATGGGRIDDDRAAGSAGSDRATRDFLRALQRPRQPLLLDAAGGRESGSGTSDASGASVAGIEHSDDSGVFAAGARAIGTGVWNLARTSAAGTALAGNCHAGRG